MISARSLSTRTREIWSPGCWCSLMRIVLLAANWILTRVCVCECFFVCWCTDCYWRINGIHLKLVECYSSRAEVWLAIGLTEDWSIHNIVSTRWCRGSEECDMRGRTGKVHIFQRAGQSIVRNSEVISRTHNNKRTKILVKTFDEAPCQESGAYISLLVLHNDQFVFGNHLIRKMLVA